MSRSAHIHSDQQPQWSCYCTILSDDVHMVKEALRDLDDDLVQFYTVDQIDPTPSFEIIHALKNHRTETQIQMEGYKILGWAAKNYCIQPCVEMGATEIILRSMEDVYRASDHCLAPSRILLPCSLVLDDTESRQYNRPFCLGACTSTLVTRSFNGEL